MKILKFIFIVLTLQSVLFSCKKEKKYPEKILKGIWVTKESGGFSFKSNSVAFFEKYNDAGKWYYATDAEIDSKCSMKESSYSSHFYHSDTLSYKIEGDLLIRERREFLRDLNSNIVTDTFRIKLIKPQKKTNYNKTALILIPLNYWASDYYTKPNSGSRWKDALIGSEMEYTFTKGCE